MSRQAFDVDLVIVGAGFAGLVCARSAALRGLRVLVLERKPAAGHKIHTTGLLVKEVAERWEVPPSLTRRIRGVRLYAPSLRYSDLDAPGYYFLATDTAALMRWFANEAERAGARLRFGFPYRGSRRTSGGLELIEPALRTRFLVGADGPQSAVARDFGLSQNRKYLLGVEAEYRGLEGIESDRLHCFVDSRLAPGYIGWVVPGVDGIAQVGLACRRPARPDLAAFSARLSPLFDWRAATRISQRGGLLPVGGRVAHFGAERVLLVGDAAGLVSPLTAGGIHTALDSGWRAAHAIADYLLDRGIDPVCAVARDYPRFVLKRGLRFAADLRAPNACLELLLGSAPMQALARSVYFHRRGPRARGAVMQPTPEELGDATE